MIQETTEANDDLIGSKIANRIIEVSKNSPKNNSEAVMNENDNKIPKERNIYSQGEDRKL